MAAVLPRSLASRTASRLNALVKDLRTVVGSPRFIDTVSIPRGDAPLTHCLLLHRGLARKAILRHNHYLTSAPVEGHSPYAVYP